MSQNVVFYKVSMNIKQKITSYLAAGVFLAGIGLFVGLPAQAANCGVETAIIDCPGVNNKSKDIEKSGVWGLLLLAINILTAGVGIAAVGGIVYGSVLYTSAGGNTEQVKKAIAVIRNVIIGLIMFVGMYAFLQFIIPGGVL